MKQILVFAILCLMLSACVNDMNDVKALSAPPVFEQEVATDVKIYYSDSAKVKVIIKAPTLKRHSDKKDNFDEFPDGILVEFLDDNTNVTSWLEADYAVKMNKDNLVRVKDNVKFYNADKDKLETSELIWNNKTGDVYTDKFVKISQPSKRDTSYGFGFKTDQKFSRFEISKFQAVKNADILKEELKRK